MAKKKDTIQPLVICQGAVLERDFFEKKENRLFTLFLKGFIVYLLSMGSIGFYLSAFKITYNALLCHVAILVMSMFCAMLYYRLLVENLGYLILFVLFALAVFRFRDYINSGFYAVVNITTETASQYMDVDMRRLYDERIGNRYVTVTFMALFVGVVLDILLNVYVSRRMQYVTALVIIMGLNLIPLFLVQEPDMLYVVMMVAGIAMALVFKAGKHYSPQVSVKRDNRVFKVQGKKKRELSYVYDVKAMLQAGAVSAVVAVFLAVAVSVFWPKDTFNVGYQGNKYKDEVVEVLAVLLLDGLGGFHHSETEVGGVDSGKLGNVSSVNVDNMTDLVVELTPYDTKRVYLKNFEGVRYNPYENTWTNLEHMNGYEERVADAEATALADAYEEDFSGSAYGIMRIRNVDMPQNMLFKPYYTSDVELLRGTNIYTYYPRVEGNEYRVTRNYYDGKPYFDDDLYVPEENIAVIEDVVKELGYLGTQDEIIEAVKDYYQMNIPYTIRPGKTPRRKDFVNHFLTEGRKGYCVHFASAAVLIFRYLGIPARYVEGYAVDYRQILDGELVETAEYSDFYQGYSLLGETGLVSVNVTDADAHAWVEVYDSKKGWYPVEVTPISFEEEDDTNFWDEFGNRVGDGNEGADDGADGGAGFAISDKLVQTVVLCIAGVLLALLLFVFGKRIVLALLFAIRFSKANINDRLIMRYSLLVKKKGRDKAFRGYCNYEDQLVYLIQKREQKSPEQAGELRRDMERVLDILERAGFSNRMIEQSEYDFADNYISLCKH